MGKKSMKAKRGKKTDIVLHSMIKNLKPKVYITDSSNFKNLVQELTGNNYQNECASSSVQTSSQENSSSSASFPAQTWEFPNHATIDDEHVKIYQENEIDLWLNNDSSSFHNSSLMEVSRDLSVQEVSLNYGFKNSTMDFSSEFDELESLLAISSGSGSISCNYDTLIHPQVSVYDCVIESYL